MIKTIDIQNHIAKRLKSKFPNYPSYVEDNRSEIKGHAFTISVRPLLTTGAMKYKNKLVNVDISYLSKDGSHEENIIMSEQLEDVFNLVLEVRDRKLYIEDLNISENDTVLRIGFTLNYNASLIRVIENDLMENLEIGADN